jgi:hypothetical protein
MDDVSDLELGGAEDLGVFFGDEESSEGEEVGFGLGSESRDEILGLRFQFGRQRCVQRHGNLQVGKGVAEPRLILARRVQKFHQLFSCLHPGHTFALFIGSRNSLLLSLGIAIGLPLGPETLVPLRG